MDYNLTGGFSEEGIPKSSLTFYLLTTVFIAASVKFLAPKYFLGNGKKSRKIVFGDEIALKKQRKGLEAIPQIEPLFPIKFIGNIPLLLPVSKVIENLGKILDRYGDIAKFVGLNETIIFLHSAPLVESLLKSQDYGHISKVPFANNVMKPFIINGVVVSNGEFWRKERKIIMRTQSGGSLKGYMGMLNRHSVRFVRQLEKLFSDGKEHQINEQINILLLKVITELIAGDTEQYSEQEFNEYHHNLQTWKECVAKRVSNPILHLNPIWYMHPTSWKYSKAVKYLCNFAEKQLLEHKEKRKNMLHSSPENSAEYTRCLLDELIDAGVDDVQIVDEVNTMLSGGHETTAATLHFFCYCVALNPEIQRECQKEIDALFDSGVENELSFNTIQTELKYVERVFQETMRLFPPVFELFRTLHSPLDIEYRGEDITLPVGTIAIVSPYLLHRKVEYFPDPEKFNPDRFLPEVKRHAYSYIPFSAGPRNCLGMKFAMIELKTAAAHLLRRFDLTTSDKMGDVPLMPYVTLTPQRDYMFSLKKRNL